MNTTTDPYVTGQTHRQAVGTLLDTVNTPHAVLVLGDAGEYTSLLLTLHSRVEQLEQRATEGDVFAQAELPVLRTLLGRLRSS